MSKQVNQLAVMKISFRRDSSKKYLCSVCDQQFNWGKGCMWGGSYNDGPEYYVCCEECKRKLEQEKGIKFDRKNKIG